MIGAVRNMMSQITRSRYLMAFKLLEMFIVVRSVSHPWFGSRSFIIPDGYLAWVARRKPSWLKA